MRSLNDILELSTAELDELIGVALDIAANPEKYHEAASTRNWQLSSSSLPPAPG